MQKKLISFKREILFLVLIAAMSIVATILYQQRASALNTATQFQEEVNNLEQTLEAVSTEFETLKNTDPHKTNLDLEAKIATVEASYTSLVELYEKIDDFQVQEYPEDQIAEIQSALVQIFAATAELDYELSASLSAAISEKISEYESQRAQEILAATQKAALEQQAAEGQTENTTPAVTNNTPPNNGYSRQVVSTDVGSFTVSMIAGDLNSTRVIVDTASGSDCSNDCPVLSLGEYVSRNGAYAGVNGSYFCPASYPSCAGKTNTFDLLLMNKNKTYFNSDNNVYSSNPGVVFGSGYIRFLGAVSGWGRDTSIDGMISNYPLLVSGGNVVFGGDSDPKKGSKGNRSFVANRGNTAYIGVVFSATVAESARALDALGMDNALNLDSGGSTALWFNGYVAGPGRNIPNAILFVQK